MLHTERQALQLGSPETSITISSTGVQVSPVFSGFGRSIKQSRMTVNTRKMILAYVIQTQDIKVLVISMNSS